MATLTVYVAATYSNDDRALAVPFDVFTPEGALLAQGVASPGAPASVDLSGTDLTQVERVYVVARLPSRERVYEVAHLYGSANAVTLRVGKSSPHEWLEWVTPFRSLEHLKQQERLEGYAPAPRRIGHVWLTVWEKDGDSWSAISNQIGELRDKGVRLVELYVQERPQLLQIGGDDVAWRMVSLPPGGRVRVAVTRSSSANGDSVEVTVGRVEPVNELLMAYLSKGANAEAARFADAWKAADIALYRKRDDPVSAAAGAYLLLKLQRLDKRVAWVKNLADWFPHLSDGPIVAAALTLQAEDPNLGELHYYLLEAIRRGPPLFSLGASVLVETMSAIHRGAFERREFREAYQIARTYLQAQASSGAYFAFHGRSPNEPSSIPIFGSPQFPAEDRRPRRSAQRPSSNMGWLTFDSAPPHQQYRNFRERALVPGAAHLFHQARTSLKADFGAGQYLSEINDPTLSERRRAAFTIFDDDE